MHLGVAELEAPEIQQTLGVLLKNQEDISVVEALIEDPLWAAKAG